MARNKAGARVKGYWDRKKDAEQQTKGAVVGRSMRTGWSVVSTGRLKSHPSLGIVTTRLRGSLARQEVQILPREVHEVHSGPSAQMKTAHQERHDPTLLDPYDWGPEGMPEGKPFYYVPGKGYVFED